MTKIGPEQQESRIGELLVKEGFLDQISLEKALERQALEKELQGQSIGQILLKTGALSEENLKTLLDHPDLKRNIGTFAIREGLITEEQLADCLARKPEDQLIGDMLIKENLLTYYQVQELLSQQFHSQRIGELAVTLGFISEEGLQKALFIQKTPRRLGEIVVDLGFVTPLDLYHVLNKYKKFARLGEILLRNGYIEESDLKTALREQSLSSSSLGDILVRQKLLSRAQLLEALSRQSNIPYQHLDHFVYSQEQKNALIRIVSQKFAEKNLIIPISLKQRVLTIAFFRTETARHARELREIYSNFTINCILVTEEKFVELFEILYSQKLSGIIPVDGREIENEDIVPEQDFMQIELSENIGKEKELPIYSDKDIEAEELVNYIINYGINKKASDIHLEQDRTGAHLRFRIDGVLQEMREPWLRQKLQQKIGSVVSRIKVIANLDIAEKRLPQDGVFRINYLDKSTGTRSDIDFRVATCRAITGENVTIRILDNRKSQIGLDNLNHSPHVLESFKKLLHSSAGIILVTGPTGSGKTSSLYAALRYIYNPSIKIITAEDPIEYSFPGIMQTQVNSKINLSFSRLLRSFLRLDPDVILIGEMRDKETAQIGFDAAQTGHLVLTTLHTNDAVSAISRLQDLDIELSQIAACLLAILAQRLLRRGCSSCAEKYVPLDEEWRLLFDSYPAHLTFHHGSGCDVCGHTGYSGRTLISELFLGEGLRLLGADADVAVLKELALSNGMKSMLDDGLSKLSETTLGEILRVVPHEMIQSFKRRQSKTASTGKGLQSPVIGDPTGRLIFSAPEEEDALLDRLYRSWIENGGPEASGMGMIDRQVFGRFIIESFTEIAARENCSRVAFGIERNAGHLDLVAFPVT
jgi:type II secretory ATPase GspE/PulE/Tfp pilus assembly ATPase PilB-like protein